MLISNFRPITPILWCCATSAVISLLLNLCRCLKEEEFDQRSRILCVIWQLRTNDLYNSRWLVEISQIFVLVIDLFYFCIFILSFFGNFEIGDGALELYESLGWFGIFSTRSELLVCNIVVECFVFLFYLFCSFNCLGSHRMVESINFSGFLGSF